MREERVGQDKAAQKRRNAYLVMLLFCLAGMLAFGDRAEAASPYAANGRLSVSKGKIVNSKGKSFVIKGVSTHGLAWYPEYVNKEAFKTLRDTWGVNTIRLAMYTADYNGYCTGGSQKNLKKKIDQGVKYATDLGMYVIIDWHILSDGNPLTYKKQAKQFFQEIARKYSGYGNVMYEICNEPNGRGGSWKNIKSYAKDIIKTIRSVNKNAIIIVGTPTWSQDVDKAQADPVTGYKNIAYAFHFYAGTHKSGLRSKLEKAVKKGLPVIVTEFGISEASGGGKADTAEGNRWMKLLDQYGIGRVCWNLSNKNETSALLKSSCKKKSGWKASDLSASGKWLVQAYTGKPPASGSGGTGNGSSGSSSTGNGQSLSRTSAGKVKLHASLTRVNSWKSGGKYYTQYKLVLKNTGSKTSSRWQVSVKLKQSFSVSDKWCGSFVRKEKTLTIKPLEWNKKIKKNGTAELGFVVKSAKAQTISSILITAS
ncbi:MAG: cellulase family glycosylhydrolase [Lachnospiraceae bacterium]|nr:cellulase family glycosylhydrolase [Lachnospiraceae bacterium]